MILITMQPRLAIRVSGFRFTPTNSVTVPEFEPLICNIDDTLTWEKIWTIIQYFLYSPTDYGQDGSITSFGRVTVTAKNRDELTLIEGVPHSIFHECATTKRMVCIFERPNANQ